jgi:hypothetical protein
LADNGGFAETHAVLTGSPAIDLGNNNVCPIRDERGALRNFDGDWNGDPTCDSGAYEYRLFDNPAVTNAAPWRSVYTTSTPILSWGRVTWAVGYQIQVGVRPSFSPEVIIYENSTLDTSSLSHMTDALDAGVYYWRMRAKRADGSWGAWSAHDIFLIMI